MRIDSSSIFTFYFPYEGHEIAIPVRATEKKEAVQKLLDFFKQWGMELSLEMPLQANDPIREVIEEVMTPNSLMYELRIEELVKDIMPLKKPKGAQTLHGLVKLWTGFPHEPQNYLSIISELESIKNGHKNGQ